MAPTLFMYALAQGLLIGFLGSSATFGPLLADISHWFEKRRGLAVAIVASGNYLAGTVWPPIVQHLIETFGWRHTHFIIGVVCLLTMLPLTLVLRRRPPHVAHGDRGGARTAAAAGSRHFAARAADSACALPALRAAWRCRCRRCISSPTAVTSATDRPPARACCR